LNINYILEQFKIRIEAINPIDKRYLVSKGNQNGFEILVPEIAQSIKEDIGNTDIFDYTIHLGHHFPDMDLKVNGKLYGLELKSRNNGSWDTNGNSVFESISDEEYDEIYLLFGTKESQKDHILVRYDQYWKVTAGINVTHSPRFKINMNTSTSVFSTAEEYYKLREKSERDKVLFLQNYLKENTTGVKWFVPQDSSTDSIKPTSLNLLPSEIQEQVKAEVLVLYPQDLISAKKAVYSRAHEFIITNHFYYSSSFRDFFSAGGKWEYNSISFPQSVGTFHNLKEKINYILENANEEFREIAYQSWSNLAIPLTQDSFVVDYKRIIDLIGNNNFAIELEHSGLKQLSNLL
jgi:hypothetical protein